MKKIFLFLAILLQSTALLMAQNNLASNKNTSKIEKVSLSGKITDAKTNEPLPGASVYFADDKIGAVADANGKYLLNNVPAGHHIIEISSTGYATLV